MDAQSAENIKKDEPQEGKQYRDILKYTGIFGGVQGLNMLAGLVRNKLTAIILGTSGYGYISIYNSAISLINNSTNLGISFSSIKNLSHIYHNEGESAAKEYVSVIRFWSFLASFTGIIVCFLLAGYFSNLTFESDEFTNDFRLLSLVVGLTTFSACELSILKATRRISDVARISLMGAVGSVFIVVPIYYLLNEKGIVPALLALATWIACITSYYTFSIYPFEKGIFSKLNFKKGLSLLKLGISFIIAGIFGSGAEYLIRAYITKTGTIDDVGLYNAGFAISVTYMGMIFVAMENDYFPKLSSLSEKTKERNVLMNNQIEIAIWLISPMIAGLLLFMPIILPLLYSGKFLPAQDMILWTSLFMFFKALVLPVAYLTLAKGESVVYMILQLIYDIFFVGVSFILYNLFGLKGLGMSISLSCFFDIILNWGYSYWKYGFKGSKRTLIASIVMFPMICSMMLILNYGRTIYTLIPASILAIIISVISFYFLNKRTGLVEKFLKRNS